MTNNNMDRTGVVESLLCKGSWALGTACGRCARCHVDAAIYIDKLKAENARLSKKLAAIVVYLPPTVEGFDFILDHKVRLFDEARRIAQGDRNGL